MVTTIPSQFDPKTALSLPNLGGDFDVAGDLEEARGYAVEELSDIRENKAALKTLKTLHDNGELDPANEIKN